MQCPEISVCVRVCTCVCTCMPTCREIRTVMQPCVFVRSVSYCQLFPHTTALQGRSVWSVWTDFKSNAYSIKFILNTCLGYIVALILQSLI